MSRGREYDLRRDSFRADRSGQARRLGMIVQNDRREDEETMTRWKTDLMKNSAQSRQVLVKESLNRFIF